MASLKFLVVILLGYITLFWSAFAKTPDPYKVLGVPRQASEEQIKEGFKKRSKKYHPDRNKVDPRAKEKFQKVVNAYELLKDPERRRMYDMTGDDNPQQHPGGGFPGGFGNGFGINIEDLIRSGAFGGGFGGFGGHQQHQQQQQGGQRRRQQQQQFTFSFGGGQGMRFQF